MGKLTGFLGYLKEKTDIFFPEQIIFRRQMKRVEGVLIFLLLAAMFSLIARPLTHISLIGYDWAHHFETWNNLPYYPPWTKYIVQIINFPSLIGVTLAGITISIYLRFSSIVSAAAAFLCFPLFWTIFLGQVDGIVVAGLLGLPWLIPLATIKPQIAVFGLAAKRVNLVAAIVWLGLSFFIWGFWLPITGSLATFYPGYSQVNNISLRWFGLPFFLITVWLSRGDMDMLMASGAFLVPSLHAYHFLPLVPAVSRLKPRAALLATAVSFLTLTANWIGQIGWYLGWIFVIWVWLNLAANRYPQTKLLKWLSRIN